MDSDKKQKVQKFVTIAIMAICCVFIAPFVFLAIKGLVGVIAALFIGYVAIQFGPYAAMKISNLAVGAQMNEAKVNRIETLVNIFEDRSKKLREARQSLDQFYGQLGVFKESIRNAIQKYPDRRESLETIVNNFEAVLKLKNEKFKQAALSLQQFAEKVDEARVMHEIAMASHSLSEAMGDSEDDIMNDILAKIAFESVQADVHKTFSELDSVVVEMPKLKVS